jgi:hypothetical protein
MSTITAAEAATRTECIAVSGNELLWKVREIIHQGNVRRVVIISEDRTSIIEFPVTIGMIGAVGTPALVAIGAIAALAKNYTLLVEVGLKAPRIAEGSVITLPPNQGYSAPTRTVTAKPVTTQGDLR